MVQPPQTFRSLAPAAAASPVDTPTPAQNSVEATQKTPPIIFCDIVQTVGIHNGIARIVFIRLDVAGKPVPALELLIPVAQAGSLVEALQAIRPS